MSFRSRQPGCPCCDDVCKIDRFAAETAVSAEVIRSAEHPQSPYPAWLQAEIKVSVGDTIKLLLAWDDTTPGDGLYVEFTPADGETSGTLKLFRKGGTQLGDTLQLVCAAPDVWHRITLCYDPDTDEFTACFDARDTRGFILRGLCVSADAPNDFAAGRKAGYDGEGFVRNYKYDRLWYLGTGIEDVCCRPTIVVVQDGQPYVKEVIPTWTIDFSQCNKDDVFQIRVWVSPGEWHTQGFIYTGDPATMLAEIIAHGPYSDSLDCDSTRLFGVDGWEFDLEIESVSGCAAVWKDDIEPVVGQPALNETQTVSLPYAVCMYALSFRDQQTSDLTETSTASEVQVALEALSSIGAGNVSVSGSVGGPFTIEFVGDLAEQSVESLMSVPTAENCLDCYLDDYGDYSDYGEACERVYCHQCGGGCTIVDEDFSDLPDGDMPCGWDVGVTDWAISGGVATGNGTMHHRFDIGAESYQTEAQFDIGTLATNGDSVTLGIVSADELSVTITRIASDNYEFAWTPASIATSYSAYVPYRAVFTRCPRLGCASIYRLTGTGLLEEVITGSTVARAQATTPVGVMITQPTLAGHSDSSLTDFSITKTREMDPTCTACCDQPLCRYCIDSEWPSEIIATIRGFEQITSSANIVCDDFNNAFYLVPSGTCASYFREDTWPTPPGPGSYPYIEWYQLRLSIEQEYVAGNISRVTSATGTRYYTMVSGAVTLGSWYIKLELVRKIRRDGTATAYYDADLWLYELSTGTPFVTPSPLFDCLALNHTLVPAGYYGGKYCGGFPTTAIATVVAT